MKLILFDIDGTLLDARGAGSRALMGTLEILFKRPFSRNGVRFAGRTDRAIVSELMLTNGVVADEIETRLQYVFNRLPVLMAEETKSTPSILYPGVGSLLDRLLKSEDVILGLLTGNLRDTASIKLASAGIDPSIFQCGAFGDESADRNQLPPRAIARARRVTPSEIEDAIIVGDTPADIECAHVNDMKAIAVATGMFSPSQLAAYNPDRLFPDLVDTSAVIEALFL